MIVRTILKEKLYINPCLKFLVEQQGVKKSMFSNIFKICLDILLKLGACKLLMWALNSNKNMFSNFTSGVRLGIILDNFKDKNYTPLVFLNPKVIFNISVHFVTKKVSLHP